MSWFLPYDETGMELYSAGQVAPAGEYARVRPGDGRRVVLDRDDILPASCDGQVAQYRRVHTLQFVPTDNVVRATA